MPRPTLKPLVCQTVVITGATSGIGLVTTRLLSRKGAKLLLIARSEDALGKLCEELRTAGGTAEYAVADVADRAQVEAAAAKAHEKFGGFDTWINNAGAAIYGRLDTVPEEDQRRLFDVVYWGVVHGTLVAAETLKTRGGAIINVGSMLGEFAIPYQGTYCAAKFAVKGFTEAFRREAYAARHRISLTLIKPAAIDTPIIEHARNLIGSKGTRHPVPTYHPDLVARAIAHACEHPLRDIVVGGAGGLAVAVSNSVAPRAMDFLLSRLGRVMQTSRKPGVTARRDSLYEPREDLSERSSLNPLTRKTSLVLEAQLNPAAAASTVLRLGARILPRRR